MFTNYDSRRSRINGVIKMKDTKTVKCDNKECGYTWEFKGKSTFYAQCPMCRVYTKLRVGALE